MIHLLEPQRVLEAAARLEGIANRTPVMTSRTLNGICSSSVWLKCENFQRVGAFKFRGAYNAVNQLSEAQRAAGVITHSSGNHAQGLALAARLHGVAATIVMPHDAPPNKRQATAAYGATIVECDAQDREEVTASLIDQHGYTLIHPYDNDHIIAGQGTAALELFEECGPLDALFVPVGGGGLLSGSALAAQLKASDCRVIGVEPEIAQDATQSWRSGTIHKLAAVPDTVADGLRTRAIGERNLAVMQAYVADMMTVSEQEIMAALEFAWGHLKLVIEPSSAVALAPLLTGAHGLPPGSRAGVLLSGGNVNVAACGFLQPQEGHVPPPERASTPAETDEGGPLVVSAPSQKPPRPRILVTTALEPRLLSKLSQLGDVDYKPDLPLAPVPRQIASYAALVSGPQQAVGSDILENGYNIRVIGSIAFHPDNIDVSAARAMGVSVIFAPTDKETTLAEQTIARLVSLSDVADGPGLEGKTLGLVGFGPVGRLVAERARAFGMNVLVNQPRLTAELALESAVTPADLNDLLASSDFISLHLPLHPETDGMIGALELARLRPSAALLNGGHPRLVDEQALLAALIDGQLAAAAVPELLAGDEPFAPYATKLRLLPNVLAYDPVIASRSQESGGTVADQVVDGVMNALNAAMTPRTLDLEVVPVAQVSPHENIDQKRVDRLMSRLEADGLLVNPPITTFWKGRYVILDGATRYSALAGLGYPHVIVQVVPATHTDLQLHTWYHAISSEMPGQDESALVETLSAIPGLSLKEISPAASQSTLQEPDALCYLKTTAGRTIATYAIAGYDKLDVMNTLVDGYNAWGRVERTLNTDMDRLQTQFPDLVAIAVFPQFAPNDVFDAAAAGNFLPAGLTRFVIPGRILRLNAELARLKVDESLENKRAWFDAFISNRLAQSRLRYYQEPVILLDE